MKYKSKDYAMAIVELILKEVTPTQEKKLSNNFLKLLEKNRDIKKTKKIISLAESLYFKKIGKRKIILETARKIKNLSNLFAKKNDVIEERINPKLIAGIKIIINNEKQLDFSLKDKLDSIF